MSRRSLLGVHIGDAVERMSTIGSMMPLDAIVMKSGALASLRAGLRSLSYASVPFSIERNYFRCSLPEPGRKSFIRERIISTWRYYHMGLFYLPLLLRTHLEFGILRKNTTVPKASRLNGLPVSACQPFVPRLAVGNA
jgi:hypothetical protein